MTDSRSWIQTIYVPILLHSLVSAALATTISFGIKVFLSEDLYLNVPFLKQIVSLVTWKNIFYFGLNQTVSDSKFQ